MHINYYQFPLQQLQKPLQQNRPNNPNNITPPKTESNPIDHNNLKLSLLELPTVTTQPQRSPQIIKQYSVNLLTHKKVKSQYHRNKQQPTYEQILQRNITNRRNAGSSFQATFKPHKNQSMQLLGKENSQIKRNRKEGVKKGIEGYLLGDGPVIAKTKYEKILQQHLAIQRTHPQPPAKQQNQNNPITPKIKQTQKRHHSADKRTYPQQKQPHYSTHTKKQQKQQPPPTKSKSSKIKPIQHTSSHNSQVRYRDALLDPKNLIQQKTNLLTKRCDSQKFDTSARTISIQKSIQETNTISNMKYSQKYIQQKQLKKYSIQKQRWIAMNFHERQQKVIENRKQKQRAGRQKKVQQQIKDCTFQPHLNTKCKIKVNLPENKNSYLEQYFDRIYRKY